MRKAKFLQQQKELGQTYEKAPYVIRSEVSQYMIDVFLKLNIIYWMAGYVANMARFPEVLSCILAEPLNMHLTNNTSQTTLVKKKKKKSYS